MFFASDIAALHRGEAVEQAAFAAVRAVALRSFKEALSLKVTNRTPHGRLRELQLLRNRRDRWPAFARPICAVRQVKIHADRAVRQLRVVEHAEITHPAAPHASAAGAAACAIRTDICGESPPPARRAAHTPRAGYLCPARCRAHRRKCPT